MFASKDGAYPSEVSFWCSTLGSMNKDKTRLKRPARNKQASILQTVVNYGYKSLGACTKRHFYNVNLFHIYSIGHWLPFSPKSNICRLGRSIILQTFVNYGHKSFTTLSPEVLKSVIFIVQWHWNEREKIVKNDEAKYLELKTKFVGASAIILQAQGLFCHTRESNPGSLGFLSVTRPLSHSGSQLYRSSYRQLKQALLNLKLYNFNVNAPSPRPCTLIISWNDIDRLQLFTLTKHYLSTLNKATLSLSTCAPLPLLIDQYISLHKLTSLTFGIAFVNTFCK